MNTVLRAALAGLGLLLSTLSLGATTPESFLPSGLLGMQLGMTQSALERNKSFSHPTCTPSNLTMPDSTVTVDQTCTYVLPKGTVLVNKPITDNTVMVGYAGHRIQMIMVSLPLTGPDDQLPDTVVAYFSKLITTKPQVSPGEILFLTMPPAGTPKDQIKKDADSMPALIMYPDQSKVHMIFVYAYFPLAVMSSEMSRP